MKQLTDKIRQSIPPLVPKQSVFGLAPSLSELAKMPKEKRKMFRGAKFWYYFRVYYPYAMPIVLLIFMISALAGWNTVEGHLVLGSVLSLLSAVAVIASYLMIVPWRKHPSSLILYRTLSSAVFSVNIILNAISINKSTSLPSCRNYSVVTQMMLLAGEGWLTTIAIDLVSSLTNPFTSYKQNLQRYQVVVWGASAFIASTLFYNPRCQGEIENGICWLNISFQTLSCLWGYYLFWILCMYLYQMWAAVFAYFRLRKGLPATFEIRKQCAIETFRCLSAYAVYLTLVMFFFLIVSSNPISAPGSPMNNFSLFLLFVIANKGTVDGAVWFMLHDFARDSAAVAVAAYEPVHGPVEGVDVEQGEVDTRTHRRSGSISVSAIADETKRIQSELKKIEEKVQKKVTKTITELADIAIEDVDETDLSPQVNMALRQQIVQYVTNGVRSAVNGDHRSAKISQSYISSLKGSRDPAVVDGMNITEFALDGEHPFKAFAPEVFRNLRLNEGISDEYFLKVLSSPANERLSEGASGAFMFFCGGGEFIVKTIRGREARVLHDSLPAYENHLKMYKQSFLCRFLGSYSLALYSQTFYFVIMLNCFDPSAKINERYDIKGSWVGRSADPGKNKKKAVCRHCNTYFVPSKRDPCTVVVGSHEANVVLKDNDMRTKINLSPTDSISVVEMIRKDGQLLGQLGVLDYSLLVGVKKKKFSVVVDEHEFAVANAIVSPCNRQTTYKATAVTGPALYYLGIVDFLQDWTFNKRVERAFKIYVLRKDPEGLSVMEPSGYMSRFLGKIDQVFAEDVDTKDSVARPGSSQASTPTPLEAVGTTATAATGVAGVVGGHITRPPSRTGVVNPMLSEISLDSTDKL